MSKLLLGNFAHFCSLYHFIQSWTSQFLIPAPTSTPVFMSSLASLAYKQATFSPAIWQIVLRSSQSYSSRSCCRPQLVPVLTCLSTSRLLHLFSLTDYLSPNSAFNSYPVTNWLLSAALPPESRLRIHIHVRRTVTIGPLARVEKHTVLKTAHINIIVEISPVRVNVIHAVQRQSVYQNQIKHNKTVRGFSQEYTQYCFYLFILMFHLQWAT